MRTSILLFMCALLFAHTTSGTSVNRRRHFKRSLHYRHHDGKFYIWLRTLLIYRFPLFSKINLHFLEFYFLFSFKDDGKKDDGKGEVVEKADAVTTAGGDKVATALASSDEGFVTIDEHPKGVEIVSDLDKFTEEVNTEDSGEDNEVDVRFCIFLSYYFIGGRTLYLYMEFLFTKCPISSLLKP